MISSFIPNFSHAVGNIDGILRIDALTGENAYDPVMSEVDNPIQSAVLIVAGLVAGLIDSVAGGGGLITVPTLTLLIGPGALAIGTNKIAAVCSSLFALVVYLRQGHVSLRGNRVFALVSGFGALLGASLSPRVPPEAYRWLIITVCPLILWIVYRKDIWIRHEIEVPHERQSSRLVLWAAGLACGFYDGIAGPGGGTLMFLSLFLVARIPLIAAMATAKVANLSSASISLATFAYSGHVIWTKGALIATGISVGAAVGATYATRHASKLARLALLFVASVLILKLVFS